MIILRAKVVLCFLKLRVAVNILFKALQRCVAEKQYIYM